MKNIEIWKDIYNYENLYEVSNFGRVRNKETLKFLSGSITNKGYIRVKLSNNNMTKNFFIHVLVAKAFITNYLNKPQVNHKDSNKKNNYAYNLEWCTNGENQKHAYNNGLRTAKGSKNAMSKLTEIDVKFIKYWIEKGFSNLKIAEVFNISKVTISHIKCGRTWKEVVL